MPYWISSTCAAGGATHGEGAGWDPAAFEAARAHVVEHDLRFEWIGPGKTAPGRRYTARPVLTTTDDGLGRGDRAGPVVARRGGNKLRIVGNAARRHPGRHRSRGHGPRRRRPVTDRALAGLRSDLNQGKTGDTSGALRLQLAHLAVPTTEATGRLRKPRRIVRALEAEQLEGVRSAIRQWQQPIPGKPGPRHTGDLTDVVDLMLATGARIGEILAVRWEDADLGAEHPTVTICGTIVYLKGKGFFRQERTKSDAGYRTVILPRFAVGMLLARKLTAAGNCQGYDRSAMRKFGAPR